MMDKRIGAQYFTIRDFCKTLEDFEKSCEKVSRIGYKTVQLSGIGNFCAEDVKRILDKYDLFPVCTHRPWENYVNDIDSEIRFHKTIGCPIAGIGSMPGFNAEKNTVKDFIEKANVITEKLSENGLIFAYHNHAFEFQKTDGKYVIDILTDGIKNDSFKYIIDAYWVSYAGINAAEFIRKYKGKIACVHFKDLKMKGNDSVFAPVGEGNLNWDDIINACNESGVQYALVEQDICEKDPFECLEDSYKFLSEKGFE